MIAYVLVLRRYIDIDTLQRIALVMEIACAIYSTPRPFCTCVLSHGQSFTACAIHHTRVKFFLIWPAVCFCELRYHSNFAAYQ